MSGLEETIFDDSRPVGMDVANSLKARIFAGEYRPGDILSERKLAREYNTSRQPVHDALELLERHRMVERVPGKGMRVSHYDPELYEGFLVVREELEALAVRLACESVAAGSDPAPLAQLIEETRSAIDTEDPETAWMASQEFHVAIVRLADNQFLTSLLDPILLKMHYGLAGSAPDLEMVLHEHIAIHDAIVSGDIEAADIASREHARPFDLR